MDKAGKKSFVIMRDLLDPVELMTDDEAGKMLKAMISYWDDVDFELPRELSFAFLAIRNQFDRDWDKYRKACESNRLNGAKGGRPNKPRKTHSVNSKPNEPERNRTEPTITQNNPDTDTDTDNGTDTKILDQFDIAWGLYPKRAGNNPKKKAGHAWSARINEGVDPSIIIDGIRRYAKFVTVTQKMGTEFTMQAATFFGPEKPFEQSWDIPKPTNIKKSEDQWVSLGESLGITARPGESMNEYLRRIEVASRDQSYA